MCVCFAAGRSLSVRLSLSQLYSSSVAVNVVCQAVCHMAMTRALICRDLLILQHLYLRLGDNVSLYLQSDDLVDEMRMVINKTCVCVCVIGPPSRHCSVSAAAAGFDSTLFTPIVLLSPAQTAQPDPRLTCTTRYTVCTHTCGSSI